MPAPAQTCSPATLLACVQHAWRTGGAAGGFVTVLLVLAVLAWTVWRTVGAMLAQNEEPLEGRIEDEYGVEVKRLLDEHLDRHPDQSATSQPLQWSLPLRTRGRHIVGADGRVVKLASLNWYGASDAASVPGGLDAQHRAAIAAAIRRLGFNSVRLPYSDQLVAENPVVCAARVAANPDLAGARALAVLHAVARACTAAGLGVVVNNHITQSRWCCDGHPCDLLWSNALLGPLCAVRLTEARWRAHWRAVMAPLADDPLVLGADLRNEPRGLFGGVGWRAWAAAAERAGNDLLALNPAWLVVVEGTASANDLARARRRPVRLAVPGRLVYSAHVYGWSGWGALAPYWSRGYAAFRADMRRSWGWLLDEDVAPVWVGEFGAPHVPRRGDAHYWRNLMRYLHEVRPEFAYWALNPVKPDGQGESYALVEDDWVTPRRDYRMWDMLALMRRMGLHGRGGSEGL